MRITTRGRYALRASLALARLQDHNSPVSINQLAQEEQISSVFLEQIFFKLRKAGIVSSVRGPGGGFQFAKTPEELTLLEILQAAGEELDVTDCDKHAKVCEKTGVRCASHSVWEDITRILKNYLEKTTLAMVINHETGRSLSEA
ncbi:MAG: Rrf2 family transcriptional regulator [Treponema sp.]|jgi:Rrf2 family iron-sulfur cluster assembly transcriptional regulator|nr:Rrf2 family transcriptional regulator [Treponema sp.]